MATQGQQARHTTFREIKIHTAKCERCNKHNYNTIYRCIDCTAQCCTPCWEKMGNGDGIHPTNWTNAKPIIIKSEVKQKTKSTKEKKSGDAINKRKRVKGQKMTIEEEKKFVKELDEEVAGVVAMEQNVSSSLHSKPTTASSRRSRDEVSSSLQPDSRPRSIYGASTSSTEHELSHNHDDVPGHIVMPGEKQAPKRKINNISENKNIGNLRNQYAWAFKHASEEGNKKVHPRGTFTPINSHHIARKKARTSVSSGSTLKSSTTVQPDTNEEEVTVEYANYLLDLSRSSFEEATRNKETLAEIADYDRNDRHPLVAAGLRTQSGVEVVPVASADIDDKATNQLSLPSQLPLSSSQPVTFIESEGSDSEDNLNEVLHSNLEIQATNTDAPGGKSISQPVKNSTPLVSFDSSDYKDDGPYSQPAASAAKPGRPDRVELNPFRLLKPSLLRQDAFRVPHEEDTSSDIITAKHSTITNQGFGHLALGSDSAVAEPKDDSIPDTTTKTEISSLRIATKTEEPIPDNGSFEIQLSTAHQEPQKTPISTSNVTHPQSPEIQLSTSKRQKCAQTPVIRKGVAYVKNPGTAPTTPIQRAGSPVPMEMEADLPSVQSPRTAPNTLTGAARSQNTMKKGVAYVKKPGTAPTTPIQRGGSPVPMEIEEEDDVLSVQSPRTAPNTPNTPTGAAKSRKSMKKGVAVVKKVDPYAPRSLKRRLSDSEI